MDNLSKTGVWLNRVILIIVSGLFIMIGLRNILHPAEAANKVNIILNSATAFSVARVSMGAFPLGFAILILTTVFFNNQLLNGIYAVFILMIITSITRIMSLRLDGHSDFGQMVLVPELIITLLSATGLYLELRRRKLNKDKISRL